MSLNDDEFFDTFNLAIGQGDSMKTSRKGLINLIPKDEDGEDTQNWRSITLLTVICRFVCDSPLTQVATIVGGGNKPKLSDLPLAP